MKIPSEAEQVRMQFVIDNRTNILKALNDANPGCEKEVIACAHRISDFITAEMSQLPLGDYRARARYAHRCGGLFLGGYSPVKGRPQ
jgi:hypothetical protein